MNLPYFENSLSNGMRPQPNDYYRELQQARINDQWDNTSAQYTVQEQNEIGSKSYTEIRAWINYVVGQGSTGYKNGDDFRQLTFQDIIHPCVRGRYYMLDDNIWIAYFTDEYDSLAKTLAIRRCNNALRWVNPTNGNIESVPCVVDYDMSSPSTQVTSSIITPNNHATVMIQGNELTNIQLKTNMRFILGNRPFKLYGYQNTILDDLSTPTATLLYLDLYLDEIQANDDMVRKIAFNGHYNYTITPSQMSIDAMHNTMGNLTANVLLNGSSVIRPLVWKSTNESVVTVDNNGTFTIVGNVGDTAIITIGIEGNEINTISIPVSVVDAVSDQLDIYITPNIVKIRQYENIDFEISVSKNSEPYNNCVSLASLDENEAIFNNAFLSITEKGNNLYTLSCSAFDATLKTLWVKVVDTANGTTYKKSFNIKTVNMFG